MRKILLFSCFCFAVLTFQSCSESSDKKDNNEKGDKKEKSEKINVSDVPAPVVSSYNAKYPGATDVEWKNSKEDGKPSFKAKFKINGVEKKAEFATDGSFIKEKDD